MAVEHAGTALALASGAGLATGVGSLVAFLGRRSNLRFLAGAVGFSAGVMIYLSFVELLGDGRNRLVAAYGSRGDLRTVLAFFAGVLAAAAVDRMVPSFEDPHAARAAADLGPVPAASRLRHLGLVTAVTLALHNVPEGIATFTAAVDQPTLGVTVALAIGIHNVPEGIAVAVPIFYATGDRRKAFWLSLASGLAEPLGALLALVALRGLFTDTGLGWTLSGVAGVMVFVALDEMLPAARAYDQGSSALLGLVSGMAFAAFGLLLF